MNGIKFNYSILLLVIILLSVLSIYKCTKVYGYFIGLPNEKEHEEDNYLHIYAFQAELTLPYQTANANFKTQFLSDINTKSKIVYGVITSTLENPVLFDMEYYFDNHYYVNEKTFGAYRRYLLPANREPKYDPSYVIWDMNYNTDKNIYDFKIKFFKCVNTADAFFKKYFVTPDTTASKHGFFYKESSDLTNGFLDNASKFVINTENKGYDEVFKFDYTGLYIDQSAE